MSTNAEETNHDPFEEEDTSTDENQGADENAEEETDDEDTSEDEPEGDSDEEGSDDESEDETEEGQASGVKEKMIPESRLKAAIRAETERAERAEAELAKYTAQPIPDRATDPDGYIRYVRLETSKSIMRQTHPDYSDKIKHFQVMAKDNPHLNQLVADHEMPAKFAYDLAARDLEIKEISEARQSDEWKEFQEFKKSKGNAKKTATVADDLASPSKLPKNLNKATAANRSIKGSEDNDDYLWKGSVL